VHVFVISLPSIIYWVSAITLNAMGANEGYNGKEDLAGQSRPCVLRIEDF
jgi:hypothetical protein